MVSLWVTPEDIEGDINDSDAYEACQTASYVLWALSGRKYPGRTIVTEVYECPCVSAGLPTAYLSGGQVYNTMASNYYSACAGTNHAHLRLRGRPIVSVNQVKLQGSGILAPNSYWVEDNAVLAVAGAHDLCDIEVSYTYGLGPPAAGRRAARFLATQLLKSWSGEDCELPQRVTSVTRQGMTMTLLDDQAFLENFRTGVYSVDLFLKAVNPSNAIKPARVFSPDLPRARRVTQRGDIPVLGPFDLLVQPNKSTVITVPISALAAATLQNVDWSPAVQINSWNGAILTELAASQVVYNSNDTITITLTANQTAKVTERSVWDLYARRDSNHAVMQHLLSGNVYPQVTGAV